jgi:hypothetical protein
MMIFWTIECCLLLSRILQRRTRCKVRRIIEFTRMREELHLKELNVWNGIKKLGTTLSAQWRQVLKLNYLYWIYFISSKLFALEEQWGCFLICAIFNAVIKLKYLERICRLSRVKLQYKHSNTSLTFEVELLIRQLHIAGIKTWS